MKSTAITTRNQILGATLELVARQGFHGTSVSLIAERADTNVGSLYYHFKNKDDLVLSLYKDCKARITERAFRGCTDDMPTEARLKRMMDNLVRYFAENRLQFLYVEQFENSPYFPQMLSDGEFIRLMAPYKALYADLKAQRKIKEMPMNLFQSLLEGALTSLIRLQITGEAVSDSELDMATGAIWDMVKK